MKKPRVIPQIVGELGSFSECFGNAAHQKGIDESEANELLELVPADIKHSACFLDRLTGLWRYDFGLPFDGLPGGQIGLGTHMFVPIEYILSVLCTAKRRLNESKLFLFLQRLSEAEKHYDVLAEFMPVIRLPDSVKTEFEVAGYGRGNHTIDWLLYPPNSPRVLLDVKRRVLDLFIMYDDFTRGRLVPDSKMQAPTHDVNLLFRSLENKFRKCETHDPLQGVWIYTSIKQESTKLRNAFDNLDSSRIHFAVLGDWKEDVYVIAREELDANLIASLFGRTVSDRFIIGSLNH